jgi:hypothetical protein
MTCKTDNYGNKMWYNAKGEVHRLGGLPAIECTNGDKYWYENGKHNRLGDLPATEYVNGEKHWYENGKRHRLGGLPAIEYSNGTKFWHIYNKFYTHKQVINYYETLTKFGRYCLKKIRLRQLRRVKFTHVELLGMPIKGRYPGGQDSHKVISYFMNYVKN